MLNRSVSHWRALTDTDRATAYSPSSCPGVDIETELLAYTEHSERARRRCHGLGGSLSGIRYGPGPAQSIDLFEPSGANGPVPLVIYFHGGYWQELSKSQSLFAAADCLSLGIAFAAVGYTLAPAATVDQIVEECRAATGSLRNRANALGIDPNRIVVAGSSAGAQLAATVGLGLRDGWRPSATCLVSGVFELEPLIGTYINDALRLTTESAVRNSPLLADLGDFPPTLIAYGENETNEFKRQSIEMFTALGERRNLVRVVEIEARNHFDVVLDLCQAETELGHAMLSLIKQIQTE